MTRNQIRDLIALRLGNRTDLNDRIVSEMQLVQNDLEQEDFLPWFLLSHETFSNDATNTHLIDLSTEISSFILPYESADLEWQDTDGTWVAMDKVLSVKDLQRADSRAFEETTPAVYAAVGDYFQIYPDPEEQLTFRQWVYLKDTVLSTDITNGWTANAPELLASLTCAKMAPQLQMADLVEVYAGMAAVALGRLRKLDEARRTAAINLSMQYGNGNT